MGKDSFIFYRSFAEAIDDLPDKDQLQVYRAIKEYALNEKEVELTGVAKSFFILIKPQLIANNKRYKNGCRGGKPPKKGKPNDNQNVTEPEPNGNQDETEKEPDIEEEKNRTETKLKPNENENENENVNENNNDSGGSKKPPGKKLPLRERDPVNDMERVEKAYLQNWDTLYSQKLVQTPDPVVIWNKTRKLLKDHFEKRKLKPEQIIQALNAGMNDNDVMKGGYSLSTMLTEWMLNRLINAVPRGSSQREKLTLE